MPPGDCVEATQNHWQAPADVGKPRRPWVHDLDQSCEEGPSYVGTTSYRISGCEVA